MSSTQWNDTSCKNISEALSCQAIQQLIFKEAEENEVNLSYMVRDPSCAVYRAPALQSLNTKLCCAAIDVPQTALYKRICDDVYKACGGDKFVPFESVTQLGCGPLLTTEKSALTTEPSKFTACCDPFKK